MLPATSLKYAEIAERIRARINSGEYEPGDRLPSEPHIQQEFGGVSKATVLRAAMAQLRSEGLVETRHGLGTFVRESKELVRWAGSRYKAGEGSPNRNTADVMTRFERIGYPVDEVDEDIRSRMPTPDEAAMLRLPDGVPVFIIQRTHLSSVPVETADIISRADRFVIQVRQEVQRP